MRIVTLAAALPLLIAAVPGGAFAAAPGTVLADNAATSTPAPAGRAPDATAYPNSPNGSPAATNKGAPVKTDRAGCGAACADSPAPSGKADTSDTAKATPTTTNAR